ncbi:hypothetical protein FXO37_02983 [Capsicum annuum]|nr:hypothetical protein FXO37_02983 [Capsicum annuum]
MDEVWINYCDMPVCFGWKEFAIVTGLKYYPPSPSHAIPILTQNSTPHTQKGKGKSCDRDELVSIIGPSFKNKNLIEALKVVVDGLSGDGAVDGGSGAAVGAIDVLLTVFKINHYEYDQIGCTDFAFSRECSACKCQDCKAKNNVVINAINALTASVKELTSKRGVIPSKRILYPSTPLEIKDKRRRKVISKALSSIQKSKIATPLSVCCIEQCTMAKEEQHKLKNVNIYVCSN